MPRLKTKDEALRDLTLHIVTPYNLGKEPPRYPVPATMDNAIMALFNQREVTRWSVEYFKRKMRT